MGGDRNAAVNYCWYGEEPRNCARLGPTRMETGDEADEEGHLPVSVVGARLASKPIPRTSGTNFVRKAR